MSGDTTRAVNGKRRARKSKNKVGIPSSWDGSHNGFASRGGIGEWGGEEGEEITSLAGLFLSVVHEQTEFKLYFWEGYF